MDPIKANTGKTVLYGGTLQQPFEQQRVIRHILQESSNLPLEERAMLLAFADLESKFSVSAKNPHSSAYGVFQIIDKTWTGLGYSKQMRNDLSSQISAGVKLFRQNQATLQKKGKYNLTPEQRAIELYVLHHDGPSGKDYGGRKIAEKHIPVRFQLYLSQLTAF